MGKMYRRRHRLSTELTAVAVHDFYMSDIMSLRCR